MTDRKQGSSPTRRTLLKAAAAIPLVGFGSGRSYAQDRPITKVLDFETAADVAKAEKEGEFLFYTHDGETAAAQIMEAFNKDFPKIKANYVRAQTGALLSKILAER